LSCDTDVEDSNGTKVSELVELIDIVEEENSLEILFADGEFSQEHVVLYGVKSTTLQFLEVLYSDPSHSVQLGSNEKVGHATLSSPFPNAGQVTLYVKPLGHVPLWK